MTSLVIFTLGMCYTAELRERFPVLHRSRGFAAWPPHQPRAMNQIPRTRSRCQQLVYGGHVLDQDVILVECSKILVRLAGARLTGLASVLG